MPTSAVRTFTDPYEYQAAVRASDVRLLVQQGGAYVSDHTLIDLHRLWMQRGTAQLPFVAHAAVTRARSPIFFLADAVQRPMHHTGMAGDAPAPPGDCCACTPRPSASPNAIDAGSRTGKWHARWIRI